MTARWREGIPRNAGGGENGVGHVGRSDRACGWESGRAAGRAKVSSPDALSRTHDLARVAVIGVGGGMGAATVGLPVER